MSNPQADTGPPELPADADDLPSTQVAQFVERLASKHGVTYHRTRLEDWAEAVTRAAGDDVTTDHIKGLLVRLLQKQILNGQQFARLLVNHRREMSKN